MYTAQILQGFINDLNERGLNQEAHAVGEIFFTIPHTQEFTAGQVSSILEKNGFPNLSVELGEKWINFL